MTGAGVVSVSTPVVRGRRRLDGRHDPPRLRRRPRRGAPGRARALGRRRGPGRRRAAGRRPRRPTTQPRHEVQVGMEASAAARARRPPRRPGRASPLPTYGPVDVRRHRAVHGRRPERPGVDGLRRPARRPRDAASPDQAGRVALLVSDGLAAGRRARRQAAVAARRSSGTPPTRHAVDAGVEPLDRHGRQPGAGRPDRADPGRRRSRTL